MLNIVVGSKLFANYGAMYPTAEYAVVDFDGHWVIGVDSEGETRRFHFDNIKREGERSVNGSPIGVFLLEEKAFNPNPEFAGDWDDYYDC